MHIKLTDGKSTVTTYFDDEQQDQIRTSNRPVSTAFSIAKKKLGVESGIWPLAEQPGIRDYLTKREKAAA